MEVRNGQGKSNGTVNGIRYFTCRSTRSDSALFVRRHQISKVSQGYGSKMQRRAHVREEHRRHRREQAEAEKRNRAWEHEREVESQSSMQSVPTRDAGRAEPVERASPTRAGARAVRSEPLYSETSRYDNDFARHMAKLRGGSASGGGEEGGGTFSISTFRTKQMVASSSRPSSTKKRKRPKKGKVYENGGYLLRKSNRRTTSSFGTDGWDRRFALLEGGALVLYESDVSLVIVADATTFVATT